MYTRTDLSVIPYPLGPLFTARGLATIELRGLLNGLCSIMPLLEELSWIPVHVSDVSRCVKKRK